MRSFVLAGCQADDGHLAILLNHYTESIWFGQIRGYSSIADIPWQKTKFRVKVEASIVWAEYTSNDKVMFSGTEFVCNDPN